MRLNTNKDKTKVDVTPTYFPKFIQAFNRALPAVMEWQEIGRIKCNFVSWA